MAGSRARGVDAAKAPEAIRSIVTTYLARHRYDAVPSWPLMFAVRWPDQRTLTTQAPDWHRANNALREWARRCGCATTEKNRLMVTPVALIDTVGVTDEATALHVVGEQAARRYRKARERIDRLVGELDVSRETASVVANMLDRESDTDFTLAIQAARFFATHDVSGMTPRQVPLAGFSAKWLDQTHAKRRGAICTLCGKDSLGLSERPVELRMRWLDPADADKPEMMVTTPWQPGSERDICYVIIVENKDTYLGMPAIRDGLCVWGAGRAIEASISLLPWLGTSGERGRETHVVYWGDMDADGLEILDAVRQAGVRCRSLFMDAEAYRSYSWFGTNLKPEGTPIATREPKATPMLYPSERELYQMVCGADPSSRPDHLRVEQERIPLADAVNALRSLGWPIINHQHQETR